MVAPNQQQNAVTRRLELLYDQWDAFVEQADARLLRWLVDRDEARVVATLVALENHEEGGRLPHLFVELDAPFSSGQGYGFALTEAFCELFERGKEQMVEADIDAGWFPPAVQAGESGLATLLRCCRSFQQHYAELAEVVVLVLQPSQVGDHGQWAAWLRAAAEQTPWPELRYLVCDTVTEPLLDGVHGGGSHAVASVPADLDMAGAIKELSDEAGGLDQPHGQFRTHHVGMITALDKGDVDGAAAQGDLAAAVAAGQGWSHLIVAVHMALGAGLMGAGRLGEAAARYAEAEKPAQAMEKAGDPLGTRLRYQARLGLGAVYVSAGRFADAATVYEGAAPLAEALDDAAGVLEAWRMACYGHEQAGDVQRAWRCGQSGLAAGDALDPEQRKHSTLAYLGQGLERLARSAGGHHVPEVDRRMTELLGGPHWRPKGGEGR